MVLDKSSERRRELNFQGVNSRLCLSVRPQSRRLRITEMNFRVKLKVYQQWSEVFPVYRVRNSFISCFLYKRLQNVADININYKTLNKRFQTTPVKTSAAEHLQKEISSGVLRSGTHSFCCLGVK